MDGLFYSTVYKYDKTKSYNKIFGNVQYHPIIKFDCDIVLTLE